MYVEAFSTVDVAPYHNCTNPRAKSSLGFTPPTISGINSSKISPCNYDRVEPNAMNFSVAVVAVEVASLFLVNISLSNLDRRQFVYIRKDRERKFGLHDIYPQQAAIVEKLCD